MTTRGGERRVFLQSASNHDWLSLINYPSQAPSSLHFKSSLGSIPTFDNHHLLSIVFPMGQKKNNSRIDGFSLSIANKSLRQPRRRPRALFRPGSRIATHAHQSAFVDLISYSTVTRAAGRGGRYANARQHSDETAGCFLSWNLYIIDRSV